jgi:hypothetical protein
MVTPVVIGSEVPVASSLFRWGIVVTCVGWVSDVSEHHQR